MRVRRRRETSCQVCQPNPWTPTSSTMVIDDDDRPSRRPAPRSSSRAATSRFPTTSAPTSRRSWRAWSASTAPSTSSTSNSTTRRNRRQRKNCQHVEITARGRGPVVRGEACADSFYAALESAVCKLESRLRRSKDRRKIHYGDKTPVSLAEATADRPLPDAARAAAEPVAADGRRWTITNPAASCAPRSTPPSR